MSSKPKEADLLDNLKEVPVSAEIETVHLLRSIQQRLGNIERMLALKPVYSEAPKRVKIVDLVFNSIRRSEDLSTFEIFKEVAKQNPEITLAQVQHSLFQLSQSGKVTKLKKGVYRRELIASEE